MQKENIPFTKLQDNESKSEIRQAIDKVIDSNSFVLGSEVEKFEYNFSKYCNTKHCVTVANGTDALELSLRAFGVSKDDKVIVPVNSFAATALAVIRIGATPVFVDCDLDYLIDLSMIANQKVKAIIPVHLYGKMVSIEAIRNVVDKDTIIIEDAAQAHGSTYNNQYIGSLSDAAATSFYPTKNLGCYGDGGAVLTNSFSVMNKLKSLRNYGSSVKYYHEEIGFNSRLDELQASILNIKLKYLDKYNDQRILAAKRYDELLKDFIHIREDKKTNKHIYHLYVIEVKNRDECLEKLSEQNIEARIHYPVPLHLQSAFSYLNYKTGDFPNAEKMANQILSLPMFPGITTEQQERVVDCIRKHYECL